MKILNKSLYLIVLLSLSLIFTASFVRSEEDAADEESANDEGANLNDETLDTQTAAETEADEEGSEDRVTSSPYVKTNVLFIQPEASDLPAGRLVKLLVGFHNNGTSSFLVDSIDGSFRYPQDFSYYIQNFSVFEFNKVIDSEKEATFEYLFTPSETFSSRQFGLTINLRYRNPEGKAFINAVFNDTVNIVEPDEGLDGETFFLYIFLAAIIVLFLVGIQQFFLVKRKGKSSVKSASKSVSNGNSTTSGDVDLEWIPKEHLQTNKSPKVSPRQRKVNQKNGSVSATGNSSNDEQ